VLIDGNDTTGEPAHLLRRRIGYVIQGHGLFPHRTVAENIATVRDFSAGMRLASAPASRNCCACSSSIRRSTPQHSRISSRVVSSSASVWRGRSPLSPPYC